MFVLQCNKSSYACTLVRVHNTIYLFICFAVQKSTLIIVHRYYYLSYYKNFLRRMSQLQNLEGDSIDGKMNTYMSQCLSSIACSVFELSSVCGC